MPTTDPSKTGAGRRRSPDAASVHSNAQTDAFRVDPGGLSRLVGSVAADRHIAADTLSLTDFSGESLAEQLADLLDLAQSQDHRAITTPSIGGADVRIVAYPDDAGLIVALRYDPLFFAHGAEVSGGWEEPASLISMRADGTDLDVCDLEGIVTHLVNRANGLLAVLRAALNAGGQTA